jgi:hypothetical protein
MVDPYTRVEGVGGTKSRKPKAGPRAGTPCDRIVLLLEYRINMHRYEIQRSDSKGRMDGVGPNGTQSKLIL